MKRAGEESGTSSSAEVDKSVEEDEMAEECGTASELGMLPAANEDDDDEDVMLEPIAAFCISK